MNTKTIFNQVLDASVKYSKLSDCRLFIDLRKVFTESLPNRGTLL